MEVKFTKKFSKQYSKAPQEIKKSFEKRLSIFIVDKYHPQLNNHILTGKLQGYRSINITGDWRALFKESKNGKTILFELLGTHSQLYR